MKFKLKIRCNFFLLIKMFFFLKANFKDQYFNSSKRKKKVVSIQGVISSLVLIAKAKLKSLNLTWKKSAKLKLRTLLKGLEMKSNDIYC